MEIDPTQIPWEEVITVKVSGENVTVIVEYRVLRDPDVVWKLATYLLKMHTELLKYNYSESEISTNSALLAIRVRIVNNGTTPFCICGTGCGGDVFGDIKLEVVQGNFVHFPLHGVCQPEICGPVYPGSSVVNDELFKYGILLVELPFKANLTVSFKICGNCYRYYECGEPETTIVKTVEISID